MQDGTSEGGSHAGGDQVGTESAVPQINPTVGRIVHYTPSEPNGKGQPYPAVITHVRSSFVVNLHVLDDGSYPLGRDDQRPTSVSFDADEVARSWRWPPRN